MPRAPRPFEPEPGPSSNGQHQAVVLTITGPAAHRLTHLAERLDRPVDCRPHPPRQGDDSHA